MKNHISGALCLRFYLRTLHKVKARRLALFVSSLKTRRTLKIPMKSIIAVMKALMQCTMSRISVSKYERENSSSLSPFLINALGSSSNLVFSEAAHLHLSTPPSTSSHLRGPRDNSNEGEYTGSDPPQRRTTSSNRIRNQNNQFWFSEPPFPQLNLAMFSLPTREQAYLYSRWYFENASPTYRVLHRASVEAIIDAGLYAGGNTDCKKLEDRCLCAIVFMVWALGCQYPLVEKEEDKEKYGRMS